MCIRGSVFASSCLSAICLRQVRYFSPSRDRRILCTSDGFGKLAKGTAHHRDSDICRIKGPSLNEVHNILGFSTPQHCHCQTRATGIPTYYSHCGTECLSTYTKMQSGFRYFLTKHQTRVDPRNKVSAPGARVPVLRFSKKTVKTVISQS